MGIVSSACYAFVSRYLIPYSVHSSIDLFSTPHDILPSVYSCISYVHAHYCFRHPLLFPALLSFRGRPIYLPHLGTALHGEMMVHASFRNNA